MELISLADPANTAAWFNAVGAWLGAGGTIAAVIVALTLARRDGERLAADRADRDMGQARLVVVENLLRASRVLVSNHSASPIFDVKLDQLHLQDLPGWKWSFSAVNNASSISVIDPESKEYFYIQFTDSDGDLIGLPSGASVSLKVSFTDAVGLMWERWDNDQPERVIIPQRTKRSTLPARSRHGWLRKRWSGARTAVGVRVWSLRRRLGLAPPPGEDRNPEGND